METLEQYFINLRKLVFRNRILTGSLILGCVLLSASSIFLSYRYAASCREMVYVLDEDSARSATIQKDAKENLPSEIRNQVERFHDLMFNLSPSSELISENLEKALKICDKSAFDYYSDLSERGFYSRIVSADMSQQISIDSVKVSMDSYPYKIRTYARLYLLRSDSITSYQFESACRAVLSGRTPDNPHGIMLERFHVTKSTMEGSRQRE